MALPLVLRSLYVVQLQERKNYVNVRVQGEVGRNKKKTFGANRDIDLVSTSKKNSNIRNLTFVSKSILNE